MLIDATHAEETRVVVVKDNKVEEFDFESKNRRQIVGNIYLAKVTRIEQSLQAAFVEYGGNRHGFLPFSEIHPGYYNIPVDLREKSAHADDLATADEAPSVEAGEVDVANFDIEASPGRAMAIASITGMETIEMVEALDDELIENVERSETIQSPNDEREGEDAVEIEPEATDHVSETDAKNIEFQPNADPPDITDATDGGETASDTPKELAGEELDHDANIATDENDAPRARPGRKRSARKYKIQEVINVRQVLLVQVAKEERGNKGAALTTFLALAGKFCVLMPNADRDCGISRKITNAADRKKLKDIVSEFDIPKGASLIVRTAGVSRSKTEIKIDFEYLKTLWERIRELTINSKAPVKIYQEGDLIMRSIRDVYNQTIGEILVEGETAYHNARAFMKMIMPKHLDKVRPYKDALPIFTRYKVENYLDSMFNPIVQLNSGGYIVIGITEALVAIDVNSGKSTREDSVEQTALATNLEAAEEVSRQLRLRDLAGLIVIDFIDMTERKNVLSVEKRLKEKLKLDRARIQVGKISNFGLLEMSRQRLRSGMIEIATQVCPVCHGTGVVRSDENQALRVLRQIEEEAGRARNGDLLVRCSVGISNFLMNQKRSHISQIESQHGLSVQVEAVPELIVSDYSIEKLKVSADQARAKSENVISVNIGQIEGERESGQSLLSESNQISDGADEGKARKPRRRRRRRSKAKTANDIAEIQMDAQEGNDRESSIAEDGKERETESEAVVPKVDAGKVIEDSDVMPVPESEFPQKRPSARKSRGSSKRRSKPSPKAEEAEQLKRAYEAENDLSESPKSPESLLPNEAAEEKKSDNSASSDAVISPGEPETMAESGEIATNEPAIKSDIAKVVDQSEAETEKRQGWWSS
ncbi:MAG: Rne/Rng family ribonuclease [Roseovarius sp.]|nr:Rne/Rng family ribonuclease [Roseovarius sp.]